MQMFAFFFFFYNNVLSTCPLLLSIGYRFNDGFFFYIKRVGVSKVLKMYALVLWVFRKDMFLDNT